MLFGRWTLITPIMYVLRSGEAQKKVIEFVSVDWGRLYILN